MIWTRIQKSFAALSAFALVLLVPMAAYAQDVPSDFEGAEQTILQILSASQAGAWPIVAGLVLMMGVFVMRRWLIEKVGTKALPWVVSLTGIAAAIGTALAAGDPVGSSVIQGFLAGATATGLWEMVFKHFLKDDG